MHRLLYQVLKKGIETHKMHILSWFIFITYEVLVSKILIGRFESFWYYLSFYLLNLALFYTHAIVVLPYAIDSTNSKFWKAPFIIIIEMLVYCALSECLSNTLNIFLKGSEIPFHSLQLKYIAATVWRGIYFLLYSSGYYYLLNYLKNIRTSNAQQLEIEKMKNQLLQTKKDFLRAQINPHIIFNTLNYVKFASKSNGHNADEAIMRLSSIMRFALEDNIGEIIPLRRELEQVDNLIILNQLRFNDRVKITLTKEIEDEETNIISLCVISLVENIFKHGYLFDEQFPAIIYLKCDAETFQFHSTNLPGDYISHNSNQTGLRNIDSRLAGIYNDSYQFKYGMLGNLYCVDLKIYFPKHSL